MIGHDLVRDTNHGPQPQHWNSLKPELYERMFMTWVDSLSLSQCPIVMFDNLHVLDQEHHRSNFAFKNTTVLVSTRNPLEAKRMAFVVNPVSALPLDDMLLLFRSRATEDGLSSISHERHDEQLKLLANNLDFHAFAACAASTAMYFMDLENPLLPVDGLLQHYMESLQGLGSEVYGRLLKVELPEHGSRSIMKLYEDTLGRLRDFSTSQGPPLMDLLELMVFLQPAPFFPDAPKTLSIFDFVSRVNDQFEDMERCYPQVSLKGVFQKQPGEMLHAFEKASLGIRVDLSMLILALWRACVLQACGDERRESWLEQIPLVCFHVGRTATIGEREALTPYVRN
ncbi:hypothetical protein FZEAL_1198 [Fusarium zealandicum]|uniref:Uncharacterized protein n=1 Tax=Fusarium zealandicum TaxID=1053134 RepID=A0A8H4UTE4_9HYPO|nr:hypothetical protein FZEAL_1198 [Fusarium zealandicum]